MIALRTFEAAGPRRFTVVLLPAFPMPSHMYDRIVEELQAMREDTQIILIDFPGFGYAEPEESWTMESVADEISRTLRARGITGAVIGGTSMGGYETFALYRVDPNIFRAPLFANTKPQADTDAERKDREVFAQEALERGPQAAIDRLYSKFTNARTLPDVAIQIREWMSQADPKAIAAALCAMAERHDATDVLPLIPVPSLVISSTGDTVVKPEVMRAMATKLDNATFMEIDGPAHLSAAEAPHEWALTLSSFLDRLEPELAM